MDTCLPSRDKNKSGVFSFTLLLVALVLGLGLPGTARAEAVGEAELQAAAILGQSVARWLAGMAAKPASVGVFQVRASAPLTAEYASLVESELLREAKKLTVPQVMACLECRNPQVKVEGDSLVVTKGAPDLEALKALAVKNGAKSFLMLDLFRSKFSVYAEATLYQATGEVLGIEQFKVPAFELANSSLLLLAEGGVGRVFGSVQNTTNVPFTLNVAALEELGFGKGGITVGGIFSGLTGNMGYILPTVGFRSQFGATPVYSLANLAAGFGLTGSKAGVAVRASYDVFLGTFSMIGVDATYLFPINGLVTSTSTTLNGYVGIHMGISFGR